MPAACPICRKPAAPAYAPFCSERCKLVDLNRWFSGGYAVPTDEAPEALTPMDEKNAD